MFWKLGFLLFAICIAHTDAVCENVDTKACELLAVNHKDLCSDPCLSKMCTRFCGHCPVKCYQCHEIDDPSNCTNLVECPSKDHYCYTTQTFADDFTEVYKMGCAMKDVCQRYLGPENKRNIDVNGACCMEDKCNNQVPLLILTAVQIPTGPSTGAAINITTNTNVCENLDDMACTRFAAAKPDMCSDTCFATNVCPRMCGKCFNCYTCNDIDSVGDCNSTDVCHAGHECFTLETLSVDLRPVFRVGCLEETLCSRFSMNSQTIFGKRDGFALKGGCCKTDLCNNHISTHIEPTTVVPTTVMPTNSPSNCPHAHRHCPDGFLSTTTSCYKIGPTMMTWSQAKSYCESHCGRLADFSSRNEMINMFRLLVPHHNGNYQDERVWTDGTFSHTRRRWVWENSNNLVDPGEFRHLSTYHRTGRDCAVALVHTTAFTTTEDVLPTSCTSHHLPLCEAVRSP